MPDIQTVDVAIAVVTAQRIYAACEHGKHRDTVTFYRDTRIKFRAAK